MNPEEVEIKYKGKTIKLSEAPEDSECELVSPVYSSDVLTALVDGKEYSVKLDNYVEADSIVWSYDGEEALPKNTKSGDLDASKLKVLLHIRTVHLRA